MARSHKQPASSGASDAPPPAPAEAGVPGGFDLAGLNPEQLASIMLAASRSNQDSNNDGAGESYTADDTAAYEHNSNGELAHLPPGLGQAASALTSFAAGVKRTTPATTRDDIDELQSDPTNVASGSGGEQADQQAYAEPSDGRDAQHDEETQAAAAALGAAAADPTQGAEHEAIAAMGRLAGHEMLADQSKMGDSSAHNTPGGSSRRNKNLSVEDERARKDLHKEVERRRREQISLGIAELSQIVPNCDPKSTNKSAIVSNAVRYIQQLKQDENNNIEKWTLEKLLMDQAMSDMQKQLDATREELDRLRANFGVAAPETADGDNFFNERGAESAAEGSHQQQNDAGEASVAHIQTIQGSAEAAANAAVQAAAANTAAAVAEVAAQLHGKARSHDEMEAESSNGASAAAAQAARTKRAKAH